MSLDAGLTWNSENIPQIQAGGYLTSQKIKAAGLINTSKGFVYTFQKSSDPDPNFGASDMLYFKEGASWEPYLNNFFKTIFDVEWDDNADWLGEYDFLAIPTMEATLGVICPNPFRELPSKMFFTENCQGLPGHLLKARF